MHKYTPTCKSLCGIETCPICLTDQLFNSRNCHSFWFGILFIWHLSLSLYLLFTSLSLEMCAVIRMAWCLNNIYITKYITHRHSIHTYTHWLWIDLTVNVIWQNSSTHCCVYVRLLACLFVCTLAIWSCKKLVHSHCNEKKTNECLFFEITTTTTPTKAAATRNPNGQQNDDNWSLDKIEVNDVNW